MNEIQQLNQAVADTTTSCHEPAPVDHETKGNDEHCLGVCDCDVMTVTMSSEKSSDLTQKIKYTSNLLYLYIEPQIVLSNRVQTTSRISTPPERAILLPRQTYNVLLI